MPHRQIDCETKQAKVKQRRQRWIDREPDQDSYHVMMIVVLFVPVIVSDRSVVCSMMIIVLHPSNREKCFESR
jgi:hypothetical protein